MAVQKIAKVDQPEGLYGLEHSFAEHHHFLSQVPEQAPLRQSHESHSLAARPGDLNPVVHIDGEVYRNLDGEARGEVYRKVAVP